MAASISLSALTSELCTSLLDNVRLARCSSARSCFYLSKHTSTSTSILSATTCSLRTIEHWLVFLRTEIESPFTLVDLCAGSAVICSAIDKAASALPAPSSPCFDEDLVSALAQLRRQSRTFFVACSRLEEENCPPAARTTSARREIEASTRELDESVSQEPVVPAATAAPLLSAAVAAEQRRKIAAKLAEDGRRCAICMDDMCLDGSRAEGVPAITPCSHLFCAGCIEQWVAEQQHCPMCRATIADVCALTK